ncbi:MAG: MmgE/PrpD family protein, partial [Chloroflexi bacterium]|nr:MmgE/PrpD family protein [Chloroflexota bacterium]
AVAEARGASGEATVRAIAFGLDFVCRLGLTPTLPPGPTGWVLTSNFGVFAAAATAGMLMGLNEAQMLDALGIAYCQAAGNMQAVADAAMTKRVQVGISAQAGVMAAQMAERGITGAHDIFEGRYGYFNVYQRGEYDRNVVLDGLGTAFVHSQLSYKPYPSCRFTHGVIDASLRLAQRVRPEDVESVEIALTSAAFDSIVDPIEAKRRPRTIVDAQFSAPYTAAVALLRREVRLEDFTPETIVDPTVLAMTQKVSCRADAQMDAERGRGISPALVTARLTDGRIEREYQEWPLGHPNTPLGIDGLTAKFRRCASYAARPISTERLDRAIELCLSLERQQRATDLVDLLTAPAAASAT